MWSPDNIPNSPDADVRIDGGNALDSHVFVSGEYEVGVLRIDLGDSLRLITSGFAKPASLTVHDRITNNGNVEIGWAESATLLIDGAVLFEGSGTIVLDNRSGISGSSGSILTNAEGHTIMGIGFSPDNRGLHGISIVNHGLMSASPGNLLSIDPSDGPSGFVNGPTGVLDSAGGALVLVSGTFINHGIIQGASVGEGAEVIGGTLRSIRFFGGVITNARTEGEVAVVGGSTGTLQGTIDNFARITAWYSHTGEAARLNIHGAVTLAGLGSIELPNGAIFGGSPGSVLTNAAGHTIRGVTGFWMGSPGLGADEIAIRNDGIIEAPRGRPFVIDPANVADAFINGPGGVIQTVERFAEMHLSGNGGGSFHNQGVIKATTDSAVLLIEGAEIIGGTLSSEGTGAIATRDTATLRDITNEGLFLLLDNSVTTLAGTVTNNGTFRKSTYDGSLMGVLSIDGAVTMRGTGAIELSERARIAGLSGSVLTNDAGHTIRGGGAGGSLPAELGVNLIAIRNDGILEATGSTPLLIDPADVDHAFVNRAGGVLRASNGGILQMSANGGGALQNHGIIEALDGSTISIADGALTNYSAGVLRGGTYRVISAGALTTLDLGSAMLQTNAASIHLHGTGSAFPALEKLADNSGSLTVSGGREFSTEAALTNGGEIHALSNSRLSVSGDLTSSSSSLITGSGRISGSSLRLGGTLAPGDGIGTLSLIGNTELFATTRFLLQLGSSAETYDQLSIEGSLTLDGSLDVIAQVGFGAGEYRIASYAGLFTDNGLELGDLPAGYSYQLKTDVPGEVILSVSVPEPSTALLASIGLLKLLNRRPRQRPSQKTRS
jgi:hypothetical protein